MLEMDVDSGEKVILNPVNPANLVTVFYRISGYTGLTRLSLEHRFSFLPEGGAIGGCVGACRIR